MSVYRTHAVAQGGQKALDPLGLELQVIVSSPWVLGATPGSPRRTAGADPSLQLWLIYLLKQDRSRCVDQAGLELWQSQILPLPATPC